MEVQEQAAQDDSDHPSVAPHPSRDAVIEGVGEFLVRNGKLSEHDFVRIRRVAAGADEPFAAMALKLGLVSERDLAEGFAFVLDVPMTRADDYPDVSLFEDALSLRFLKEAQVVPVAMEEDRLRLAMADPSDRFPSDAVELACDVLVSPCVGLPSDIEKAVERLYGAGRSAMGEIVDSLGADDEDAEADIEHLKDLASEAPVIRLVNLIVQRAVELRASDIHIEPFEDSLTVRYRVDGVLQDVEAPPAGSTAAVISRIKIMANLNIAERRKPQDGRIAVRVQGKELDLRVSTVPTLFGESVVIRLLDKESVKFDFEALGFDGQPEQRLLSALDMPHGIVLVTGPTGSGKSTTLYTALHRLNTPERKIITVEDPVEYQLSGVNQIHVRSEVGLTFAGALRAIVRQDPDVIMVGEMRDVETARIAVQSALTGHLVLSTLHTNDAVGGVTRLLDMGVEDYLITSTVNGILGQRLVRRLCTACRESYRVLPEMAAELKLRCYCPDGDITLYRAKGCSECVGTGYRGRLVLSEVLLMSDPLRQLVMRHANASELLKGAVEEGMETMYQDGLRKAVLGLTTVEEVIRVAEKA